MLRCCKNHSSVFFASQKLIKNNHHPPATPLQGAASIKKGIPDANGDAKGIRLSERAVSLKKRLPDCCSLTAGVDNASSEAYARSVTHTFRLPNVERQRVNLEDNLCSQFALCFFLNRCFWNVPLNVASAAEVLNEIVSHCRVELMEWSASCVQCYDGGIKMIIPSLHEGSSEENTQGGLSSGGPPQGQWIFSVWDQIMSLVVPL